MPHAVLEYSANLASSQDISDLLGKAHAVMNASGLFDSAAIKSRAFQTEHYCVGEQGSGGAFIHITIALLEGRTLEQRADLTKAMFEAFRGVLDDNVSLSVDIREMVKQTYRK